MCKLFYVVVASQCCLQSEVFLMFHSGAAFTRKRDSGSVSMGLALSIDERPLLCEVSVDSCLGTLSIGPGLRH